MDISTGIPIYGCDYSMRIVANLDSHFFFFFFFYIKIKKVIILHSFRMEVIYLIFACN